MILWDFVPPVKQDTTYTKHVYQYSKHYMGGVSCCKGGNDAAEAKNRKCGYLMLAVFNESSPSWTVSSQFFERQPINSFHSFKL